MDLVNHNTIILLVEDSSDHAFLIRRAITAAMPGLDIHWAKNGKEAVDSIIMQGLRPDLILLDIKMPRMNGFEVLEILKSNEATALIPVVVLSTSANEKDVIRAYSLGTNSYLSKPVEITEFRSKLHSIPRYWILTNQTPPLRDKD